MGKTLFLNFFVTRDRFLLIQIFLGSRKYLIPRPNTWYTVSVSLGSTAVCCCCATMQSVVTGQQAPKTLECQIK